MPSTATIRDFSLTRRQRGQRGRDTYRTESAATDLASVGVVITVRAVATSNQATSGTPTIDGVSTWYDYAPILLTAQTDPEENGVWHYLAGGWERSSTPIDVGSAISVTEGDLHAGTLWQCADLVWTGTWPEPTIVRRTPYADAGALDFGASIAAGVHETRTLTVTGARSTMTLAISPDGDPGIGTVWSAWISADDTISVRIINATASPITLTNRTWRASVIPS